MELTDNLDEIWGLVLERLSTKVIECEMNIWFRRDLVKLIMLKDNEAVISVEGEIRRRVLEEKFTDEIISSLKETTGMDVTFSTILKQRDGEKDLSAKIDFDDFDRQNAAPRQEETSAAENEIPRDFSSEYTLDNFIVGKTNQFAYAAAEAVANNPTGTRPSSSYNPLFIYGPSGLGKTHLMYAITNRISKNNPKTKIIYVKGEEFTNQLIDSISKKSTAAFREKYRKADVLLIDDIQFVAGKESTQEEFFHTFNALYEDHKQIILTSDRPPKDMKILEDRLKSRFESGLLADIQPPDIELRIAIFKSKAALAGITIPNDAIYYLSQKMQSNIRQIEGVIKKLAAMHMLTGKEITLETVQESVSDFIKENESDDAKVDRLLSIVSKKYSIRTEDILGTKRNKEISYPRHICIYVARNVTSLSLSQIGKVFGRDHTTVMSSLNRIDEDIKTNSQLESDIAEIIGELKN